MKNKIRKDWFRRVSKVLNIYATDTVFEVSKDAADFTKPVYEVNNKLYIIEDKHGMQV